ncbi:SDR family NAD(P)-dependent oxidoreductase [Mycobacterium colombiense]
MNQRVALVTGAAGGQGQAIANRLRAKGFSVAACDLRIDDLRTAVDEVGDDGTIALELDVTSPQQWDFVIAEVVGRFGSLSTLVNCAGVLHRAPLTEETAEGFETAWRVNCLGPFLGTRAALEQLRKAANPSIVNICSTGAIRPFPQHSAYGSSKWALRGLTQTVAAELAPSGIRVNAVFPGPIATSMLDEATQARLAEASMSGRIGEPGEVADAVAFLVSAEASFITGSELVIDGGQCLQIR